MKILLVTSIFPPEIGGPATYSYQLAESLSKKHKVLVITFSKKPDKRSNIPTCSVSQKGNSLIRQWRLFKRIVFLRNKFEIIFSQDALVVGLACILAGRILRKPVVVKFVGDIVWESSDRDSDSDRELTLEGFYKNKRLNFSDQVKFQIQRWVLKKANKIIVPSKYLKDFIVKYYSIFSDNIRVVHNGVKILPIKEKPKKNRLITVGRLVSWKNIDQIIKAVSEINKKFEYRIVGSGPEFGKLKELVQRTDLCRKIRFLGKLSNKRTIDEIAKSKIFVLNSAYEGLPHVLLEAASVKTAIVAPKLPGIVEIFSKEVVYFKPGNRKELKRAIEELLFDDKKRQGLAEGAYKKVRSEFSWEKTYKKTEKVLQTF